MKFSYLLQTSNTNWQRIFDTVYQLICGAKDKMLWNRRGKSLPAPEIWHWSPLHDLVIAVSINLTDWATRSSTATTNVRSSILYVNFSTLRRQHVLLCLAISTIHNRPSAGQRHPASIRMIHYIRKPRHDTHDLHFEGKNFGCGLNVRVGIWEDELVWKKDEIT